MRRSTIIFLAFIFQNLLVNGQSHKLIGNELVTGVCYAGTGTTRLYVPPPLKFREGITKDGGSIKVYYNGFSEKEILAFDYAVKILESILPAGTRITVVANWTKIQTSGVLGNSTVTGFIFGGAIDALKPFAFYPVSLAEKISGIALNSDQTGDIIMTVNSSANWYLGTDGQVPAGQYDLVTVVLHELCHGLGFFDSMNADNKTGWYGISSFPIIYDTFIENGNGKLLTDTLSFNNNSADLLKEYTGGDLFFKGPVLTSLTNETKVKVYAPSTWDNGSSISHLDEQLASDPRSRLMTPFIDMREAIHDPGIYTKAILGDLGWINTRIIHNPMGDTEALLSSVNLEVEIRSDSVFNRDKVGLVYSFDNFKTSDTLFLTSPSADKHFKIDLGIPSYNTDLQYYFFTEDIFKRIFKSPSLYPYFRYKSYIGTDTVKAGISHIPAEFLFELDDSLRLAAAVTDNIGVDSVYLEYKINEGQMMTKGFRHDSADLYHVSLPAGTGFWKGGDTLRYRIVATDSAANANVSASPEKGFYNIAIVGLKNVLSSYSTDFDGNTDDFFLSGFEIKRLSGWLKPGLHSKHPYISPEKDSTINSIALLRYPFKIDKSGLLIQYSDIALVEPGETGAPFGSEDFYDYVVVEGSKDLGKTWSSLFDGYDSRYNSTWLKTYNSSIVDQNSKAIAKESMLVNHIEFVPAGTLFSEGDTILIRFRLFSDPYANGWGWVVQDLKINPLVDAISEIKDINVVVYPNPGNGLIQMKGYEKISSVRKPLRYEVYNSAGIIILNGILNDESGEIIDIRSHPPGLYYIIVFAGNEIRTFKYSLIK